MAGMSNDKQRKPLALLMVGIAGAAYFVSMCFLPSTTAQDGKPTTPASTPPAPSVIRTTAEEKAEITDIIRDLQLLAAQKQAVEAEIRSRQKDYQLVANKLQRKYNCLDCPVGDTFDLLLPQAKPEAKTDPKKP
jgi:hypothetical protein